MSQERHFSYLSVDKKTQIHAVEWKPAGEIIGIVQIAHGMQGFIDRYADFAAFLNQCGLMVVGNDHLGHGYSVYSEDDYGFFAEGDGNRAVIADMRELQRRVQETYPDVPYIILGHSMGSFLARQYISMFPSRLSGAIFSGTAWHPAAECLFGQILCRIIARSRSWNYRSPLVDKLAVGNFNKSFEPARTPKDWLTRDEKIVDAYIADPRTSHDFTLNAYYGMFTCLRYICSEKNIRRLPRQFPVLFISGEQDPVGNFGVGVKKTVAAFRRAGLTDITCRIYPNDRHEVLNELNRQEVYDDVWKWLSRYLK